MDETIDLTQLREAFLQTSGSPATQVVGVVFSATLLLVVLYLVRRRLLREEYTPIWVAVSVVITLVSLRLELLRELTRVLGAWTVSSTLFFLGEVFLLLICLNYAVRLSQHADRLKDLAQESALLHAKIDRLAQALGAGKGESGASTAEVPGGSAAS
jgi:hypothetical protein